MSVTATLDLLLHVRDTLAAPSELASSQGYTHELGPGRITLDANSTPAVTATWSDRITLTAGAHTIDLTSLGRGILDALDLTGLKVQAIIFTAAAANTETLRIKVGASNAYNIFGDANGEVTLPPGGVIPFYAPEGLPDVGSGAKEIDISSSDADAVFSVALVAG